MTFARFCLLYCHVMAKMVYNAQNAFLIFGYA